MDGVIWVCCAGGVRMALASQFGRGKIVVFFQEVLIVTLSLWERGGGRRIDWGVGGMGCAQLSLGWDEPLQ